MFARVIRWSFAVILIQTSTVELAKALAERAKPTEKEPLVTLTTVVTQKLEQPVYLTHAGDGSSRLFAVEQPGRIRILQEQTMLPDAFLDITGRVLSGGERGLLGLAFHPDYRRNGRFFVNYTRKPDGATVIAEYHRGATSTLASPEERILLTVPQPYPNHNGGMMSFGPDGYLYIGLGDGGSAGDPENRAQNPEELLGKILRIDIDRGDPYGIPPDNPFAQGGGRAEIYALGLRNPWRFSFDGKTGKLWVADVGQYKWEEINLVARGGNYGWRTMEGTHCFNLPASCKTAHFRLPLAEYSHEKGRCSVIGGYAYRGMKLPDLTATYVYGDYCSGEIFALPSIQNDSHVIAPRQLLKTSLNISSFGEDATGELYVLDHNGGIYRLSAP